MQPQSDGPIEVFGIACPGFKGRGGKRLHHGSFGDLHVRAIGWSDGRWSVYVTHGDPQMPDVTFSAVNVASIAAAEERIRSTTSRLAPPMRELLEEVCNAAE